MSGEVGVAVIGAGRIGRMHADIFARCDGAVLRGVVDRRQEDKEWLANAGHADARLYPDAAAAFADDGVDAVVIATSSDSHVALIEQAVSAGKMVFCEKPVAFNAQTINDLRQRLPVDALVQVGFNRRFDPSFNALRQSLHEGALGRVYTYHITNRDPRRPPAGFVGRSGGMLLDFNVHDFDMLAYLSGSRVRDVFVRGANLLRDEAMLAAGDIDTVMINAALDDGALANVDCTRESGFGYDQRVEVLGERGGLRAENVSLLQPTRMTDDGINHAPLRENFITRFRESYIEQACVFVAVCRGVCACPVGLADAAAAVAAAEAATRSLAAGKSELVPTV